MMTGMTAIPIDRPAMQETARGWSVTGHEATRIIGMPDLRLILRGDGWFHCRPPHPGRRREMTGVGFFPVHLDADGLQSTCRCMRMGRMENRVP